MAAAGTTAGALGDGECGGSTTASRSISNGNGSTTLADDDDDAAAAHPDQDEAISIISDPGSSTSCVTDEKISEALADEFLPFLRSGGWADIGHRNHMEDAHVRIDDLVQHLGGLADSTGAYYGVFDGHLGKDAAQFVREHLLKFIVDDASFPSALQQAVHRAFLRTDRAFAEACRIDDELASGTTALTALILGR